MPFDRFLIAPLDKGLQTDVRPWLIADNAWAQLTNAYVWRGRVKKRVGTRLLNGSVDSTVQQLNSRLRVEIGVTDGNGDFAGNVPGTVYKIGQLFSIGTEIFTVVALGNPANMLISGAATLATYDTATGAVVINGAAAMTEVYFYPAEPVMGFITPEDRNINDEPLYAFDTQFAYKYSGSSWDRLANEAVAGDATWTGNNFQFFQGTSFRGNVVAGTQENETYLFVTNYNPNEPNFMRYNTLNTAPSETWNTFLPVINAPARVVNVLTARLILGFQDRLILLNTVETINGGSQQIFQNRVRFGRPFFSLQPDTFLGFDGTDSNFLDNIATTEAIISAEFIKNRLIVFFERSTWELVYTGNQVVPFRWQQINTELGVESPFSVIPFDKVVMGVGNTGVHACNGSNVERIDSLIPDTVFEIHNENEGPFRVHGIRDYYREIVYWTFPDEGPDPIFPTRILMYNYKNGTWAIWNDSITAFGYYQNVNDRTWSSTNETWESTEWTWGEASLQAKFRQVIAGNQEGFTFIMDDTDLDPSLQITNITLSIAPNIVALTIIDHNLQEGQFIQINHALGVTFLNGLVFEIFDVPDVDTIRIDIGTLVFTGTYLGRGVVSRVPQITMRSKQFNFYLQQGRDAVFERVDFLVDRTEVGEMMINFYVSTGATDIVQQGAVSGALVGTSILETSPYTLITFEAAQDRLWHTVYIQAEGETIQIELIQSSESLTSTQVPSPAFQDFQLHALIFYARAAGRLQ